MKYILTVKTVKNGQIIGDSRDYAYASMESAIDASSRSLSPLTRTKMLTITSGETPYTTLQKIQISINHQRPRAFARGLPFSINIPSLRTAAHTRPCTHCHYPEHTTPASNWCQPPRRRPPHHRSGVR